MGSIAAWARVAAISAALILGASFAGAAPAGASALAKARLVGTWHGVVTSRDDFGQVRHRDSFKATMVKWCGFHFVLKVSGAKRENGIIVANPDGSLNIRYQTYSRNFVWRAGALTARYESVQPWDRERRTVTVRLYRQGDVSSIAPSAEACRSPRVQLKAALVGRWSGTVTSIDARGKRFQDALNAIVIVWGRLVFIQMAPNRPNGNHGVHVNGSDSIVFEYGGRDRVFQWRGNRLKAEYDVVQPWDNAVKRIIFDLYKSEESFG